MNKLKILCFTADFCSPCKAMKPMVNQILENKQDVLEVEHVDIEENPERSKEYVVRGLPTFVFLKEGKEVDRIVGSLPKDKFINKIESHT